MIIKSMLLAVILLFGSLVSVKAQSSGAEAVSEGQLSSDGATTQAVLGWNYFHVRNCYLDGSGSITSPTFYVFPVETSVLSFIFTTSPAFIQTIAPACQTGNWIAVFITAISGSTLSWNAVYTYAFR